MIKNIFNLIKINFRCKRIIVKVKNYLNYKYEIIKFFLFKTLFEVKEFNLVFFSDTAVLR